MLSIAYVSVRRLSRWLDRAFGVRPDSLSPAVLDLVGGSLKKALALVPQFADAGGTCELKERGVLFSASSPEVLLASVRILRTARVLSALRFGQWAFVLGGSEADRTRSIAW